MAGGPRVLFLGMTGAFSLPPLEAMLAAGIDVCAVVVPASAPSAVATGEGRVGALAGQDQGPRRVYPPAPRTGLPVLTPFAKPNIVTRAWAAGRPVYEAANLAVVDGLAALHPDVIAVACFPRLIPDPVRALARHGAVNVHPSLLPNNRGPDPLFWTFRLGHRQTGVTVHLLTDEADAGDVIAQEPVDVPDGIAGPDLERRCAELGGQLLVRAVHELANHTARPQPQEESRATYHPLPSARDYLMTTDRPARWAFNFIRGLHDRQGPLRILAGGREFTVGNALSCDESGQQSLEAVRHSDGSTSFQFRPGVLSVTH